MSGMLRKGIISALLLALAVVPAVGKDKNECAEIKGGIPLTGVPDSSSVSGSRDMVMAELADFLRVKALQRIASVTADTTVVDTVYYQSVQIDAVQYDLTHLRRITTNTDLVTDYTPWKVYGIVRTNLIGDALLIPNIGGEITVGHDWSLGADFYLQWIKDRDKDKFYQTYKLDLDARYWWGAQHKRRQMTGWHAGPYMQAVTYDWENGHKGYQSRVFFWTFGFGGDIGYNMPISRKMAIDFYIGVGYFHTKYNVYNPGHNRKYYFDHRECKNFFGPTRIGVSLNYIIK